MAYTDEQISNYAFKLQSKGAPTADIEKFVRLAKQEQQQASTATSQMTQMGAQALAGIAPANLPSTAIAGLKGLVDMFKPTGVSATATPEVKPVEQPAQPSELESNIAKTAATLSPLGLYAQTGLPGAEAVKTGIVQPMTETAAKAMAAGRSAIQQGFTQEAAQPSGVERLGNVLGTAAGAIGNVIGGVGQALYAPVAPLNAFDTRTMEEKAKLGVQGLNQVIGGAFQTLGAPLEMSPGTKGIVSAPFAVLDSVLGSGLKGLGVTEQHPEYKDIKQSLMNAIGIGLMTKAAIDKGWLGFDEQGKPVMPTFKGGVEAVKETVQGLPKLPGEIKQAVPEMIDIFTKTPEQRIAKYDTEVQNAVGQIVQGKTKDIVKAKRALSDIDAEGIKTYDDLSQRLNEKISSIAKAQDQEFAKTNPNPQPLDSYTTQIKVGNKVQQVNFVTDALNQLDELYKTTKDYEKSLQVEGLIEKAESEGLTIQEVNQIARTYGTEFGQKAFRRGEPLTTVNAQTYENVRSGVKQAARDAMPNEVTKTLDGKIGDLIETKRLVDNMVEKVNGLSQKIQERPLGQKIGGAAANVLDTVSGGTLRGFISKLVPRNVGFKTLNSLDLQEMLPANLAKVQHLSNLIDNITPMDAAGGIIGGEVSLQKFNKELERIKNEELQPKPVEPKAPITSKKSIKSNK